MANIIRDETGAIRRVEITLNDEIRWRWTSPAGFLMLPGHPDFSAVKDQSTPAGFTQAVKDGQVGQVLIQRPGVGINEAVTSDDLEEFLRSGEWDERQAELDQVTTLL